MKKFYRRKVLKPAVDLSAAYPADNSKRMHLQLLLHLSAAYPADNDLILSSQ